MQRSSLLLILSLLVTACVTIDTRGNDAGSSASSDASSSQTSLSVIPNDFNHTEHDGAYANEQYGFRLKYPTHFEPLTEPLERGVRLYGAHYVPIEPDSKSVEYSEEEALFTVSARDRGLPSDFAMYIDIFPLETYSFVNIYDDEYKYDARRDTWSTVLTGEPFDAQTVRYNGIKMYKFGFGDAGHAYDIYAIPHPKKNIMIQVMIGGCLGCMRSGLDYTEVSEEQYDELSNHALKDKELILGSFERVE